MTRLLQGAVRLRPRRFARTAPALLVAVGLLAAGCGPNRGPDYGADPVEQQALAIPPDLTAEPLASSSPFPDLPAAARFHPGPLPADGEGEWSAQTEGNTLVLPVPAGWALGTARAALLMQGVAIDRERQGGLRTPWLGAEDLRHLGVAPPADGRLRFSLQTEALSDRSSRLLAQGERRDGDEVVRAETARVTEFLQALQPAFGKRR